MLPQTRALVQEWFPAECFEERGLAPGPPAVSGMHRPEDTEQWSPARRRLAYDECLLMQLGIAIMRMREVSRPAQPAYPEIDRRIRAHFPFRVDAGAGQGRRRDRRRPGRPRPMNRLLQGDVGSGKTVVALYAMLLAVAHGNQAALMAPTEILAAQHFQRDPAVPAGRRVRGVLIGGLTAMPSGRPCWTAWPPASSTSSSARTRSSRGRDLRQLGLVVIDEQHKFGVRQRAAIRGKGSIRTTW